MTGADPLLRHIRHAEDWLRRARHDWRSGNAPAARLRLMLAEAEIRQARETGADALAQPARTTASVAARRRAGWSRAAAALAAAAVLGAGLGYAWMRTDLLAGRDGASGGLFLKEGQVGRGIARTIVQLNSGQFLMPDRGQTPGLAGQDGSGSAARDGRPFQFAVPVDLKTPSPTF